MRQVRAQGDPIWGRELRQFDVLAGNLSMKYLVLGIEVVIGVLMLPFNVAHLGQSTYGLWVLAASVTTYFSMLDLGYGFAQVKFAAEYRARRDSEGLNQVASTLFFLFSLIGLVALAFGTIIAFNLGELFKITPAQAATGQQVLLIISVYVAVGFPASVFGGIVNGFQRQYLNGFVSIVTAVIAALVNVAVLVAGYGLVELVAATTAVRTLSYIGYCINAYRAYPGLRIRLSKVRHARLKEVTEFSVFILLIDLAHKLNYSTDAMVVGAAMSTAAIAVWAVAQRLIETTQMLTGQLNGALFPLVVDSAALGEADRLRKLFVQGTRMSLAMVIPIATGLSLLAHPLVNTWVGPEFAGSVPVIHILAVAVVIRVGNSTATTLLKGAGRHRLLALSNLSMAVANIALSVVLVRSLGLVGVAVGTLVALGAVSFFVLFPAACRRVGLPIRSAIATAVWPALWPASIMVALLAVTRNLAGTGILIIAIQATVALILYICIFLGFAISAEERHWYLGKLSQLSGRRSRVAAAEA